MSTHRESKTTKLKAHNASIERKRIDLALRIISLEKNDKHIEEIKRLKQRFDSLDLQYARL